MKISKNLLNTLTRVAEANDEYPRARMAAALIKGGTVMAIGTNRRKTDPLQAKYSKNADAIYLHSEINCIKNALRNYSVEELEGSTMYVCRVKRPHETSKKWVWGLAKPCEGCSRAIAEFGIKNVVYTTDKHFHCEVL